MNLREGKRNRGRHTIRLCGDTHFPVCLHTQGAATRRAFPRAGATETPCADTEVVEEVRAPRKEDETDGGRLKSGGGGELRKLVPVFERELDEGVAAVYAELVADAGAVILDRAVADEQ